MDGHCMPGRIPLLGVKKRNVAAASAADNMLA